ncbi:uncharacterized protein JN550_011501 [Neoarthrinium moseri]|uniref:uncharacterized protein n=1 Tax=Neoarthrinium moseri TaxID=1658444 RepID=UPI001FDB9B3B|nr:uncharacterized protein JN550_011501 [Neoarthrinium moseri]KAI1860349.1 hypothetical protein JN550_011501 [Neoarthrinium moseri]
MDQFSMDLSFEFDSDSDFCFDDSQLSSASSARSFSSASSSAPITPQPGQCTPSQQASRSFSISTGYVEITPAASSISEYFSEDIKCERPSPSPRPATPAEKPPTTPFNMDVMNSSLPTFSGANDFTSPHVLEQYGFVDNMSPPPGFETHRMSPGDSSFWAIQGDLTCFNTPGLTLFPTVPSQSMHRQSLQDNQPGRQIHVMSARQRSNALQDVQNGSESGRRNARRRQDPDVDLHYSTARAGEFVCQFEGCGLKYQRLEHLRRHTST